MNDVPPGKENTAAWPSVHLAKSVVLVDWQKDAVAKWAVGDSAGKYRL